MLLAWLDTAIAAGTDLPPEPLLIQRELGRDSLTFRRAQGGWSRWTELAQHPEVTLKR